MKISVLDHRLFWILPFSVPAGFESNDPITCSIASGVLPLQWGKTRRTLSADLSHPVRYHLGYAGVSQRSEDQLGKALAQSAGRTLELRRTSDSRQPLLELALRLPESARRRLGDGVSEVRIQISSVLAFRFASGVGLLCLEAHVVPQSDGALGVDLLLEVNHLVSHQNTFRSVKMSVSGCKRECTLVGLATDFLQGIAAPNREFEWNRVFAYSCALVGSESDGSRLGKLALRLARKYTQDYNLSNELLIRHKEG